MTAGSTMDERQFAPATERNRVPILLVLTYLAVRLLLLWLARI